MWRGEHPGGGLPITRTTSSERELRQRLKRVGLTDRAIDAVWPRWWGEGAAESLSAKNDLRFTIARRLGLSPRSLFEDDPQFVWRDNARYKNLGNATPAEIDVLTSFGAAIGVHLFGYVESGAPLPTSASSLRDAILHSGGYVTLASLVASAWSVGVPVLQLRVLPLPKKLTHAMSVRIGTRYAILLARETKFEPQAAFWVAHELGHIVRGDLLGAGAFVDVDDPLTVGGDDEEATANRYALELLTGDPETAVSANIADYSARQLAAAAMEAASREPVEPGILALCLGYGTRRWRQTFGALKIIPPGPVDVGDRINTFALSRLSDGRAPVEVLDYLSAVAGVRDK